MIKKVYDCRYGKYFLSLEAEPAADSIVVKYRKRKRKDYSEEPAEEEPTTNMSDGDDSDYTADDNANDTDADEPTTNVSDGDTEDYTTDDTVDNTDTTDEPTTNDTDSDSEDYTDDDTVGTEDDTEVSDEADTSEEDDTTDYSDDGSSDEDTTDEDNGGDTDATDEDSTDYTDDDNDTGDDGSDDNGNTENDDTNNNGNDNDGNNKGPGLDYDSTRKYVLFENFNSLLNGINNYISKLETLLGDDIELNQVLKNCVKKLRAIRDLAYDYLVMKFEISSYIQSKLFYTNLIMMIQSVFSIIWKANRVNKLNVKGKKM